MTQKIFLLGTLFTTVFCLATAAQETKIRKTQPDNQVSKIISVEEEIQRIEREYNEAFVQPTADLIEQLHTDDFLTTSTVPARVTSKAEILGYVKQFGGRLEVVVSMFTEDLKIRLYGDDTAVTTGIWKRMSRNAATKDSSGEERFTRVWVKQNGKWRLAASHYSPYFEIPKQ